MFFQENEIDRIHDVVVMEMHLLETPSGRIAAQLWEFGQQTASSCQLHQGWPQMQKAASSKFTSSPGAAHTG